MIITNSSATKARHQTNKVICTHNDTDQNNVFQDGLSMKISCSQQLHTIVLWHQGLTVAVTPVLQEGEEEEEDEEEEEEHSE